MVSVESVVVSVEAIMVSVGSLRPQQLCKSSGVACGCNKAAESPTANVSSKMTCYAAGSA